MFATLARTVTLSPNLRDISNKIESEFGNQTFDLLPGIKGVTTKLGVT